MIRPSRTKRRSQILTYDERSSPDSSGNKKSDLKTDGSVFEQDSEHNEDDSNHQNSHVKTIYKAHSSKKKRKRSTSKCRNAKQHVNLINNQSDEPLGFKCSPDSVIGGCYKIGKKIGSGSFGEIFLGIN